MIMAAFFWLMNSLNKPNYSLRVNYPIRFVYDDSSYISMHPLPANIAVNISGDGWSLLEKSWYTFHADPIEYAIVNPLKVSSINSSALTDKIMQRFPDVKVNYVVADTFELAFEPKVVKVIPLRIDSVRIDIREGYVISSFVNISPSLISVEGPLSLIRKYPDTLRMRVPVRKIQNNFDEVVQIPLDEQPLVKMSQKEAYVSFEVSKLLRPLDAPPVKK